MSETVIPPIPNSLEQLYAVYGDPRSYLDDEGKPTAAWESVVLRRVELPSALALSWTESSVATHVRVHRLLVPTFVSVFEDLVAADLWRYIHELGGTYEWRRARGSQKLSTHCWGIAIDLNPTENKLGTRGRMPRAIVEVFEAHGFFHGALWTRPDPMHFQYCRGSY